MRSFTDHIVPELSRGLRPDARASRKSNYLVDAINVKCKRYGIEPYLSVSWPFAGSPTITFPFPQLIRLSEITILAAKTSLELADETNDPWTKSAIAIVDLAGAGASLTGGGQWHAVDFGHFVALFNGVDAVFRSGVERTLGTAEKWFTQSGVTIGTGTAFRGRTFLGGFDPTDFWDSTWSSILSTWAGAFKETDFANIPINDIKGNWVFYSSPGGGDFPMWLFWPTVTYAYTDFAPTADRMLEEIRINALGWIPMKWQGDVLRLKALKEHLIVYGEDGVTALTPRGADLAVTELARFGILTRDSVAGDENEHVFVANSGELFILKNEFFPNNLVVRKLDYAEFTANYLNSTEVVASFDPHDKEYYFSDGADNLILSEGGLTKHEQVVSSLAFAQGGIVGVAGAVTPTTVTIVTSPFDMDQPSIKYINWVKLDCRGGGTVTVAVDFNYDGTDTFTRTTFYTLNTLRMAYVSIAGIRFRIVISATDYTDFELDSITYEWQGVDARHRSASTSEISGSPGGVVG